MEEKEWKGNGKYRYDNSVYKWRIHLVYQNIKDTCSLYKRWVNKEINTYPLSIF